MYHYFIGIDISKDSFSAALHGNKKTTDYSNEPSGFEAFCKDFGAYLPQALVVLETTGGYEMELIHFLQDEKYAVHRANTRKVKKFMGSWGIAGKSDSIDA